MLKTHRVQIVRKSSTSSKKKIALIARDAKKADILTFFNSHKDTFNMYEIVATGETGKKIHEKTGLEVKPMLAGPQGGDLQIGALIASQNVDMVIFLRDPLTAQPHEPDISALLRVCDVHNIPLATNLASAEILINAIQNTLVVDDCPRSRAETMPWEQSSQKSLA